MVDDAWKEAIRRWQALSPSEKHRRRLLAIPDNVAKSMAFEGEPVSEEWIEALRRKIRAQMQEEGLLEHPSGNDQALLIATSAGEVGLDLDGAHIVCE